MEHFTISAAARLCHCDRRTLQRAIHAGRLHLDAHHCLSREDLLAAGYLVVDPPQEAPDPSPQDTPQAPALLPLIERLVTAIEGLWQEVQYLREDLHRLPHRAPQAPPQETPQQTPHPLPQAMPQPSPQILGTYDPQAAVSRMQALRREGLSLARIAEQLTAEGIPTRYGLPWQHSSVRHLLKVYGQG